MSNLFEDKLEQNEVNVSRNEIQTLQLNITAKCNQVCTHCHVGAGPHRKEEMSVETIDRILYLIDQDKNQIKTVDITGGAPELNTNFRYLVQELRKRNISIIDRCNLTVLFEQGQEDTAEFLAENEIIVIASLPCYEEENVDAQRGNSIYKKSILGLKKLNSLGYGNPDHGLILNLVYNPGGAFLPGNQEELEIDYKEVLREQHGIEFNQLITIVNMPINRYLAVLKKENTYEDYCRLLISNFNPEAATKIMCKSQISVGWDGKLYDCDFNQALRLPITSENNSIFHIENFQEITKNIIYDNHCFGCTAGCGSSCQGKLI